MRTRRPLTGCAAVSLVCTLLVAAEAPPTNRFQVDVDMVVLTFTVTDSKGRYVNGLHSEDVRVREDGVVQKIVAFTEGNESRVQPFQAPPTPSPTRKCSSCLIRATGCTRGLRMPPMQSLTL